MDKAPQLSIVRADRTPPVRIPAGYTGPATIPGTGRVIYWTGKVAIGLRYQQQAANADIGVHSERIQALLLAA